MPTLLSTDPRWQTVGLSAVQVDRWTRAGYLHTHNGVQTPGSGSARLLMEAELDQARRMLTLIELGFTVRDAARLARNGDLDVDALTSEERRVLASGGQS